MSVLLVRPSPQPWIMSCIILNSSLFVSLCQRLLSNTTHARSLHSQERLTQRPFTKRYREVPRKYFINKCNQTAGQEPAETLTHQKTQKCQRNKKHFRCLQHPKMLRSAKEPSEMKLRSYFMHNVTLNIFHLH